MSVVLCSTRPLYSTPRAVLCHTPKIEDQSCSLGCPVWTHIESSHDIPLLVPCRHDSVVMAHRLSTNYGRDGQAVFLACCRVGLVWRCRMRIVSVASRSEPPCSGFICTVRIAHGYPVSNSCLPLRCLSPCLQVLHSRRPLVGLHPLGSWLIEDFLDHDRPGPIVPVPSSGPSATGSSQPQTFDRYLGMLTLLERISTIQG